MVHSVRHQYLLSFAVIATAVVLPKFSDPCPHGALRIVRSGATSPLAISGYAVAEELPILEAHTSLCPRVEGYARRITQLRFGSLDHSGRRQLPCAVDMLLKTSIDWPMSLAT